MSNTQAQGTDDGLQTQSTDAQAAPAAEPPPPVSVPQARSSRSRRIQEMLEDGDIKGYEAALDGYRE